MISSKLQKILDEQFSKEEIKELVGRAKDYAILHGI